MTIKELVDRETSVFDKTDTLLSSMNKMVKEGMEPKTSLLSLLPDLDPSLLEGEEVYFDNDTIEVEQTIVKRDGGFVPYVVIRCSEIPIDKRGSVLDTPLTEPEGLFDFFIDKMDELGITWKEAQVELWGKK